jgi:hypothetical protein
MDDRKPARPAGFPGPPTPCERELEEKNAENARLRTENAQLKKQVAELKAKLEDVKRPDLGPPAGPLRPFYGETPWDKRPGGPGFGP